MINFFSREKGVGNGYKNNVLNSINWLVGFIETLFFIGVIKGPNLWIQISNGVVMLLLLIFYCSIVIYFVIKDPSRLQSEGFNLRMHAQNFLYHTQTSSEPKLNIPQQKLSSFSKKETD